MQSQQTDRYRKIVLALATGSNLPPRELIAATVAAAGKSGEQLQRDVATEIRKRGFPETSPRSRPGTNFATR